MGNLIPSAGFPVSLNSGAGVHIQLDKTALLAQFLTSQADRTKGAPSFLFPAAVDQWKPIYYVAVPDMTEFATSPTDPYRTMTMYMSIAIEKGKENGLILDGYHQTLLNQNLVPPTNKYVSGYLKVGYGTHVLQHRDGVTRFGLTIYGVDESSKTDKYCAISTVPDAGLKVKVRPFKLLSFRCKGCFFRSNNNLISRLLFSNSQHVKVMCLKINKLKRSSFSETRHSRR